MQVRQNLGALLEVLAPGADRHRLHAPVRYTKGAVHLPEQTQMAARGKRRDVSSYDHSKLQAEELLLLRTLVNNDRERTYLRESIAFRERQARPHTRPFTKKKTHSDMYVSFFAGQKRARVPGLPDQTGDNSLVSRVTGPTLAAIEVAFFARKNLDCRGFLTLLGPQSRFGDKLLII